MCDEEDDLYDAVRKYRADHPPLSDLLKPRYKVIALWPFCGNVEVGTIIEHIENLHTEPDVWCKHYNQYPHLFKPLAWWEERKPGDFPEYMKCKPEFGNRVYKIADSTECHSNGLVYDYPMTEHHIKFDDCVPATKEQYDNYINQKP